MYLTKFGSGFNLLHSAMRHEVVKHFTYECAQQKWISQVKKPEAKYRLIVV